MQEMTPNNMPVGELQKFDNTNQLSESLKEVLDRGNNAMIFQEGNDPILVKPRKKIKKSGFYNSRKMRAR